MDWFFDDLNFLFTLKVTIQILEIVTSDHWKHFSFSSDRKKSFFGCEFLKQLFSNHSFNLSETFTNHLNLTEWYEAMREIVESFFFKLENFETNIKVAYFSEIIYWLTAFLDNDWVGQDAKKLVWISFHNQLPQFFPSLIKKN